MESPFRLLKETHAEPMLIQYTSLPVPSVSVNKGTALHCLYSQGPLTMCKLMRTEVKMVRLAKSRLTREI